MIFCKGFSSGTLAQEAHRLHAEICAGLADPIRIMILYALADGPSHVSALAGVLALPQPTISRHLKILRERGMVVASRSGQMVHYRLRDRRVIQVLDLLRAALHDVLARHMELSSA